MVAHRKATREIDKSLVAKRFGRRTGSYDAATPVQARMAQKLVELVRERKSGVNAELRILEIGCGTGRLTRLLSNEYPHAHIRSIDISSSMVEYARKRCPNVDFIVADAEEFITGVADSYDLIVSNATFQWLNSASTFSARCLDLLSPGGILVFSTFGNENFSELRDSFFRAYENQRIEYRSHVVEFEGADFWGNEFLDGQIIEERFKQKFSDPVSFLRSVQSAGATNSTKTQSCIPKSILRDTLMFYKKNHSDPLSGEVTGTYHVIYVAVKREG